MVKKLVYTLPGGKSVGVRKANYAIKVLQSAARGRYMRRAPNRAIASLNKKVSTLKRTQQGAVQMDRQRVRWAPSTGGVMNVRNQPSTIQPITFLHQAISAGAQLHTNHYILNALPAFNTLTPVLAGNWVSQTFPITDPVANGGYGTDPAIRGANDQLQYWSQSQGVQNKFCHVSTEYQFRITGKQCRGYVDVYMVHPKRNFIRSVQQDVSLPNGLSGFTNLSLGSENQYRINKQYWTIKRLKRHYFNLVSDPALPNESFLHTNPDYDFQLDIKNDKSRQVITAPELFQGAILDYTDIPLSKQDWIMVSCTLEPGSITADNNVTVDIFRTPKWRDLLGASS